MPAAQDESRVILVRRNGLNVLVCKSCRPELRIHKCGLQVTFGELMSSLIVMNEPARIF